MTKWLKRPLDGYNVCESHRQAAPLPWVNTCLLSKCQFCSTLQRLTYPKQIQNAFFPEAAFSLDRCSSLHMIAGNLLVKPLQIKQVYAFAVISLSWERLEASKWQNYPSIIFYPIFWQHSPNNCNSHTYWWGIHYHGNASFQILISNHSADGSFV